MKLGDLSDIIHRLPDNIVNQIAAGEVIQRPSSAVKELLENAVDAGADEIRLIIQDAGKSLVQVTDNGKGMSPADARHCFERHATSKIRDIDDLFRIRTMGFRGEALASIAAVAQVELRTKRGVDETGTRIEIDNSVVRLQEPCPANNGTSIAMKNLFFSVPARRNFLKSNAAELRHIVDEFIHVALSFPQIFFSFTSNGQQVFHLEKGNLKQRIVQLLGNNYNAKLVSVNEQTDYLNITGFVGKPETAKKTRGDQYLFVNNRFIRSAYLNHAIMGAYQDLIPPDAYPMYVLFIDLDPAHIDINVHPTKQEIKFDDEKITYAFVQSAVKHALAQYSVMPTLDFDLDPEVQKLDAISKPFTEDRQRSATSSSLFQTFTNKHQAHLIESNTGLRNWKDLMPEPGRNSLQEEQAPVFPQAAGIRQAMEVNHDGVFVQVRDAYILVPTNRGFLVVNQQLAHERVLYERFSQAVKASPIPTQQSLFPVSITCAPSDALLLGDLLPDLQQLGYTLEPFGNNSFVIRGTPADVEQGNEKQVIEELLEQYKHFTGEARFPKREKLLRSMVRQQVIRQGRALSEKEMHALIASLFACETPNITPDGAPTYIEYREEQFAGLFRQ